MITRFFHWVFHTVAPYSVGIGLGVAFFFVIIHYLDSHGSLLQSAPGFTERSDPLAGTNVAAPKEKPQSPTPPAPTLNKEETRANKPELSNPSTTEHAKILLQPTTGTQQTLARDEWQPKAPAKPPAPYPAAIQETSNRKATINKGVPPPPGRPANQVKRKVEECPPGLSYEHQMACQWRRNCQIHLENYKKMIENGRNACPTHAMHAPMCRDYYRSLQMQIPPQACDQPRFGTWP